jgi:hypothetical protein
LHDALAAAHQGLSQPRLALERYLTPRLKQKKADFLWLMNYADALEQDAQPDRAWRLRGVLWREARRPDFVAGTGELADARRVARARLAATQRPGDARLVLLRELLALDRHDGEGISAPVKELVLGWFQDGGEYTAQRGFLWQQYAANLAKPLWAEVAAALAIDERSELLALLEQHDERLARYDRSNAARRVGDLRLATSYAFESQEVEPDDDTTHLQLAEALLEGAHRAGARLSDGVAGALEERLAAAELDLALAPNLRLSVVLSSTARTSLDTASIGEVPATDRLAEMQLAWSHDDGVTRMALGRRRSFGATTPLRIEREQNIDRRLGVGLSLGRHIPAQDSAALRAAGMQDRVALDARYQVSRVDRLAAQWSRSRLLGQTGTVFGSGELWYLE